MWGSPIKSNTKHLPSSNFPSLCPQSNGEWNIKSPICHSCHIRHLEFSLTSIPRPSTCNGFNRWFWVTSSHQSKIIGGLISWYVWKMRNNYIFNSAPIQPSTVIRKTINAIYEWNISNISPPSSLPSNAQWLLEVPPSQGYHKFEFDGAFNSQPQMADIEGNIRDYRGELNIAYSAMLPASRPIEAELHSLLHGVAFFAEWWPSLNHLRRILCLGTSWHGGGNYWTSYSHLRNGRPNSADGLRTRSPTLYLSIFT